MTACMHTCRHAMFYFKHKNGCQNHLITLEGQFYSQKTQRCNWTFVSSSPQGDLAESVPTAITRYGLATYL